MIIDTETHVFHRLLPIETNPDMSMAKRFTWHAYSGDLLVAEMDRAGVDKTILISYDADDLGYWLRATGKQPEDFVGGKKYTFKYVKKYPDRFVWFITLRDPIRHPNEYLDLVRAHMGEGAVGIKVFPGHFAIAADDPRMMAAYQVCAERGGKIIFAFEDTDPPRTPSVLDYHKQLDGILAAFPETNFQIMHGGNIDPGSPDAKLFFDTVRANNNVWVSTAPLEANAPGDVNLAWRDGYEYPFRHYLSNLGKLIQGIGADRIEWATDWPWMEHFFSYPQAVDAIRKHADFMSEAEKAQFLGLNAARFLQL